MSDSIVNTDEYQNDGRWPKLPRTNPDDARRGRNFLLVGLTLIFMLIWLASPSDEENVLVRENAAANSVSGTYSVYSGSTTAEPRGLYKDDSVLDAYVVAPDGTIAEVELWQVTGTGQTPRLDCGDTSCIN